MKRLRKLLQRYLSRPGTRRLLAGAAMGSLVLLATAVHAAEAHGGAHHINWWSYNQEDPPLGFLLLDFALFLFLLVRWAKKPIRNIFAQRHATIKAAVEEARSAFERAKTHHDEYAGKLERVDAEAGQLVEGSKRDGAQQRDSIIDGAKRYAERLRSDTEGVVAHELRAAHERLHVETARQALERAERLLRAELNSDDQVRLLEQAIAELENQPGGGTHPRPSRPRARTAVGGAA